MGTLLMGLAIQTLVAQAIPTKAQDARMDSVQMDGLRFLGERPPDFDRSQTDIEVSARLARPLDVQYPEHEFQRGHQGVAVITVFIDEQGLAPYVELRSSCGYPALDSTALYAAFDARYIPARTAGKAVRSRITVPVEFRTAREKEDYDSVKSVDELRQETRELERAKQMLLDEQRALEKQLEELQTRKKTDESSRPASADTLR